MAAQQELGPLLVVTSPYHTRRAGQIFRDVFEGSQVQLSVQPVPNHWYRPATWWQDAAALRVTLWEYTKFAMYLAGYEN